MYWSKVETWVSFFLLLFIRTCEPKEYFFSLNLEEGEVADKNPDR